MMFRTLDTEEAQEFRTWARENDTPEHRAKGDIYHPIVRDEWRRIDLAKLAHNAIQVQDACNLSGVAHGFARAMSALCDLGLSTDERNTHPIAIVWADKIAHLTGTQGAHVARISAAFDEVMDLAGTRH